MVTDVLCSVQNGENTKSLSFKVCGMLVEKLANFVKLISSLLILRYISHQFYITSIFYMKQNLVTDVMHMDCTKFGSGCKQILKSILEYCYKNYTNGALSNVSHVIYFKLAVLNRL